MGMAYFYSTATKFRFSDAALTSIYHYAASDDPEVKQMLEDHDYCYRTLMIWILIGRDRFAKSH